MNAIQENMSFRDYYTWLRNIQIETRDQICDRLGISPKTFYNKLNSDGFDYPQKLAIAEITGRPIEQLFPIQ